MSERRRQKITTNAMRLLKQRDVPFEPLWYDEGITTAEGVAAALGYPETQVFKTLVMVRDTGEAILVMTPGGREVDLRRLAAGIGAKAVHMMAKAEAERRTGLRTGGIGALALVGKRFEVYLDSSAGEREEILVNGGHRGLNLRLTVHDLLDITGARVVDAAG